MNGDATRWPSSPCTLTFDGKSFEVSSLSNDGLEGWSGKPVGKCGGGQISSCQPPGMDSACSDVLSITVSCCIVAFVLREREPAFGSKSSGTVALGPQPIRGVKVVADSDVFDLVLF